MAGRAPSRKQAAACSLAEVHTFKKIRVAPQRVASTLLPQAGGTGHRPHTALTVRRPVSHDELFLLTGNLRRSTYSTLTECVSGGHVVPKKHARQHAGQPDGQARGDAQHGHAQQDAAERGAEELSGVPITRDDAVLCSITKQTSDAVSAKRAVLAASFGRAQHDSKSATPAGGRGGRGG